MSRGETRLCDQDRMTPYDSDSSGTEDNDYTETNVLLGYASKEASDDTISHLGGQPVRLFVTRLLYAQDFG